MGVRFYVSMFIVCQISVGNNGHSEPSVQWCIITSSRLTGGSRGYEGLLEIEADDGHWFNLCADKENSSHDLITNFACPRANNNVKRAVYMSNVFDAPQMPKAAKLTECKQTMRNNFNCTIDFRNCSSLVSLCCSSDLIANPNNNCSGNWTATLQLPIHHGFVKPNITQIRDFPFNNSDNKNIRRFWTKYAFVEKGCDKKQNIIKDKIINNDTIKSCANGFLNKTLSNMADDVCDKKQICSCPESHIDLELVTKQNDCILLCIAGNVTNGQPMLEVLNCKTYLPSFVVSKPDGGQSTTTTPESEIDNETNGDSVTIAITAIILMVAIVIACVCVWYKFIKIKPRREPVNNSMNNDTYYRNAREKDVATEEYALINDMEMSSSAAAVESYRPPLPKRDGDAECSVEEQEVCTVDEYSLPKDSLPEREIDLVYSNTYDDPIRMNLKRNTSNCNTLEKNSRTSSKQLSDNKPLTASKHDLASDYEEVACVSKDKLTNKPSGTTLAPTYVNVDIIESPIHNK